MKPGVTTIYIRVPVKKDVEDKDNPTDLEKPIDLSPVIEELREQVPSFFLPSLRTADM